METAASAAAWAGRRRARAPPAPRRTTARRAGEEASSYDPRAHGSPERRNVAHPPDVPPAELTRMIDLGRRVDPLPHERDVAVPPSLLAPALDRRDDGVGERGSPRPPQRLGRT